jgi:hypothetical protein
MSELPNCGSAILLSSLSGCRMFFRVSLSFPTWLRCYGEALCLYPGRTKVSIFHMFVRWR